MSPDLPPLPHAADRRFSFVSQGCAADSFAVVRLSGFEAISQPFRFELMLASEDANIDLDSVLGSQAVLKILGVGEQGGEAPYAGVVAEFDQLHHAGRYTFYRAVLVPRLWMLSLCRSSEVYLNEQTIPQIVERVLKAGRLAADIDYEFKLIGHDYRERSYVSQYQETPFAFISRWLEREGIYYYFDHGTGRDRLVLLDDASRQPAAVRRLVYRPADEVDLGDLGDAVQAFVCRTRTLPATLVLQEFNYRDAGTPLVVTAAVSARGVGEEMLYGENFRTLAEGERYAKLRAQEMLCGERVFSGEATAVGLRSGHFMELAQHYRDGFNGRYLVTEVRHEGVQAGALLAGLKAPHDTGGEQGSFYRADFVALPQATQFRPARTTPKPRVAGTLTATVDAEGSGEYAELDDYGQYKVQIPFDRTDKGAAKGSAPMRMASPYAGGGHGMHFPLHKNAEVLLSFTDGDPDQPVILGAVPNSENRSVVDGRNPRRSMIQTKGGNEIGLDDTLGREAVWLHSPYKDSTFVLGFGATVPAPPAPPASPPAPPSPPGPPGPPAPPPPPPPPPPGNIFQATKGGSDTVTFGHANLMNFGSKSMLSLGTEASLVASLANKVTMGATVSMNLANEVKWNMNLVPFTDAVKSLTIDDSDTVTLKRRFDTTAMDSVTFFAGVDATSIDTLALETQLKLLRGFMGAYTALNLAQSTVFGMAVNGSAGGALTPDGALAENKKARDGTALPEPSKAPGFMGWPGIVEKFGIDALTNGAALVALQWRAKVLSARIKALKSASRMTMDYQGIAQTVDDGEANEMRIALVRNSGILLKAPEIEVETAGSATFEVGDTLGLNSPSIRLGETGADKPFVSILGASNEVNVATAESSLKLKDADARLSADTLTVGHSTSAKNPLYKAIATQCAMALKALSAAHDAERVALAAVRRAEDVVSQALADQAYAGACAATAAARKVWSSLTLQLSVLDPTVIVPMLNGLTVDGTKTELTHTTAAVKVTSAGVAVSYGAASFKVNASGLIGAGPLIKLG